MFCHSDSTGKTRQMRRRLGRQFAAELCMWMLSSCPSLIHLYGQSQCCCMQLCKVLLFNIPACLAGCVGMLVLQVPMWE